MPPTLGKDYLIGNEIKNKFNDVENVCYLDTDIQINHFLAPNIFDNYNKKKISMISCVKNMPIQEILLNYKKTFLILEINLYPRNIHSTHQAS